MVETAVESASKEKITKMVVEREVDIITISLLINYAYNFSI